MFGIAVALLLLCAGPASAAATVQHLTILGADGTQGDVDPYSEYSRDGGLTWHQSYLTGWHPWGFLPGTNSWVNFDPGPFVGLNSTTLYRVKFFAPPAWSNPTMLIQMKADNRGYVSFNGVPVADIVGQGSVNADLQFSQGLKPGVNTIELTLEDWGGWVGFNYRIDLELVSDQPLTMAPASSAPPAPPVPTNITQTTDVLNDGGLVVANNLGGGAQPVNVNGICFGNDAADLTNFANGGGDFFTDPLPLGTPEMNLLLDGLVYQPNGSPSTLTLTGMTPGHIHRLQLFFSNDVNATGNNMNIDINGTPYTLSGWIPNTVNLVYEFTPTSPAAVVTFGANNGSEPNRTVLNAYAVHDLELPNVPCGPTNQPPVADAGAAQTVESTGATTSVTLNGSASSDPDAADVLSYAWAWAWNGGSATGVNPVAELANGTYSITLPVDDGNGDTDTATTTVTVQDTTAPGISIAPVPATETTSLNGADVDVASYVTTSDVCAVSLNVSPAGPYALGSTPVTVSATDCANNTSSSNVSVNVVDTIAPVLAVPADAIAEASAVLSTVAIGSATATDIFPVTIASDAPATFPLGTTVVTWAATDANGNATSGTQNVTVVDTSAPTVTAQLVPISSGHDDDDATFQVVFSASDIADPNPVLTATLNGVTVTNNQIVKLENSRKDKSEFERGTLEISGASFTLTATATDASGNVGTASDAYAFPAKHEKSKKGDDDHKSKSGKKDDDRKSDSKKGKKHD